MKKVNGKLILELVEWVFICLIGLLIFLSVLTYFKPVDKVDKNVTITSEVNLTPMQLKAYTKMVELNHKSIIEHPEKLFLAKILIADNNASSREEFIKYWNVTEPWDPVKGKFLNSRQFKTYQQILDFKYNTMTTSDLISFQFLVTPTKEQFLKMVSYYNKKLDSNMEELEDKVEQVKQEELDKEIDRYSNMTQEEKLKQP